MAGKCGTELLKQVVSSSTAKNTFEKIFNKIRVISGGNGEPYMCRLTVTEEFQNRNGTLHGGATASLVDAVSTWALMASPHQKAGVSVNMNISYMKAAKVGEDINIEAKLVKVGRTLAFLNVDITNQDGALLSQGQHVKFIG